MGSRIVYFLFFMLCGVPLHGEHYEVQPNHNLGVLVRGKIYRSAELGRKGLRDVERRIGRLKTVVYLNKEGYAFPMYFAVQEYEVSLEEGFRFYHSFGNPRTYIDGENPYHPTDMIDRKLYLGHRARRYFHFGDGRVTGGVDNFIRVLKIILNPKNQPVLFHCYGGFHRTGMVAMVIRYLQSWDREDVIHEYKEYNPHFYRQKNIDFVDKFIRDPGFLMLKAEFEKDMEDDHR